MQPSTDLNAPLNATQSHRQLPNQNLRQFLEKSIERPTPPPRQIEQDTEIIDETLTKKIADNRERIHMLQKMMNPYADAPLKFPLKPKSTLSHIG